MISRIIKLTFLFVVVGFSTVSFQNNQLQSSVTTMSHDTLDLGINFDMEEFIALIFLLAILGYSITLLVYFVTSTHNRLLEKTWDQERQANAMGI